MTKGQIDALLKWLAGLGLGTNDGDVVHELQLARSDGPPVSVVLVFHYLIPHRILSSALEQVNDKLRDISDRIENAGYIGNNVVSELMDEIRATITNSQVSSKAQTGQRPKLLIEPVSYTCIHRTWRITSPGAEGMFRT